MRASAPSSWGVAEGRRRAVGRRAAAVVWIALLVAACGGSAAGGGGGGGGGGPNWDAIIAETQAAFGTSMVSGTVEADTLKITLVKGFGPGGAKLFMCANVKQILAKYGATGVNVVMVDTDGTQLSTMADCQN
jgi:hypothetical protein